jgi:hypothetical protein
VTESEVNKDTGASQPSNAPGQPQRPYQHTDSGNSGGSKQTEGGPGTAGSIPASGPGSGARHPDE